MTTYKEWEDFCNYLIHINRYILDEKRQKIVDEIIKLAKERVDVFEKDKFFWRARIGKKPRMVEGEIISDHYTIEEMLEPPKEKSKSGRANPPGISYLYLAEDIETAIAEIKPYLNANIELLKIKLKKEIKVVDIRKNTPPLLQVFQETPEGKKKDIDFLWFGIKLYFSVPLSPDDELWYIPTQYVAELFKNVGYDGIVYESVQRKNNLNLVLFDSSNAIPVGMDERVIYDIKYWDNVNYIEERMKR